MELYSARTCIAILAFCLLMSVVKETSQDKKVTYLLGRAAENCTSVCASRGMLCIEVGGFPSNASSILSIFCSLNVTCATHDNTNKYKYLDSPNYIISGEEWKGRCMGFEGLNSTSHPTLCGVGGNPAVKRLCPCGEQTRLTQPPPTFEKFAAPTSDPSNKQINNTMASAATSYPSCNAGGLRTAGPVTWISSVLWMCSLL